LNEFQLQVLGHTIHWLGNHFETVIFTQADGHEDAATEFFTQTAAKHIRLPSLGSKARAIMAREDIDVMLFSEVKFI
jgi:hypothetical protein